MKIRESAENYLEAILILSRRLGQVRSVDVAAYLGFSKPSVSVAMKHLREDGYLRVEPDGEQYEKCVAVHAECNAIISASRKEMLGATLYLAGFEGGRPLEDPQPCLICNRLIKNAGIARVINARGEVRL